MEQNHQVSTNFSTPTIPLDPEHIHKPSEQFNFASPQLDIASFSYTLVKAMRDNGGLGLAAPQIGVNLRILAMRTDPNTVMVNPRIVWESKEHIVLEEGCLSYPGIFVKVERPRAVKVRYFEPNGTAKTIELHDMSARVVQHELDHLNGITMFDKAKPFHRESAMKKLKQLKRKVKNGK